MIKLHSTRKPITETELVSNPSNLTMGGTLELKRGLLCLREADEIKRLKNGKYRFTRQWQKPGKLPFDINVYALNAK